MFVRFVEQSRRTIRRPKSTPCWIHIRIIEGYHKRSDFPGYHNRVELHVFYSAYYNIDLVLSFSSISPFFSKAQLFRGNIEILAGESVLITPLELDNNSTTMRNKTGTLATNGPKKYHTLTLLTQCAFRGILIFN